MRLTKLVMVMGDCFTQRAEIGFGGIMKSRSVISTFMAFVLVSLGVFGASQSQAQGLCEGRNLPNWTKWRVSSLVAGTPSTLTLDWTDREQCLVWVDVTFRNASGATISSERASLARNGSLTVATANWVPAEGVNQVVVRYAAETLVKGVPSPFMRFEYSFNPVTLGSFSVPPIPSAPSNISISGRDRSLTLVWAPPATNPSAVSKYVVRRSSGEPVCDVAATSLSCSISDLPDGSYQLVVTALNAQGRGAEAASSPITIGPPAKPTIIQASITGTTATISWNVGSGTTAIPLVYRVFDASNKEVCAVQVQEEDRSRGSMSCNPQLPVGQSTQYMVQIETALGNAQSDTTQPLTGTKVISSKCQKARAALERAKRANNKKLIARQQIRVKNAC